MSVNADAKGKEKKKETRMTEEGKEETKDS
jgi:hypothetical protein